MSSYGPVIDDDSLAKMMGSVGDLRVGLVRVLCVVPADAEDGARIRERRGQRDLLQRVPRSTVCRLLQTREPLGIVIEYGHEVGEAVVAGRGEDRAAEHEAGAWCLTVAAEFGTPHFAYNIGVPEGVSASRGGARRAARSFGLCSPGCAFRLCQ